MRVLVHTLVILVVTSHPDAARPDMMGWGMLVLVGLFLAFLDVSAMSRSINDSEHYQHKRRLELLQKLGVHVDKEA